MFLLLSLNELYFYGRGYTEATMCETDVTEALRNVNKCMSPYVFIQRFLLKCVLHKFIHLHSSKTAFNIKNPCMQHKDLPGSLVPEHIAYYFIITVPKWPTLGQVYLLEGHIESWSLKSLCSVMSLPLKSTAKAMEQRSKLAARFTENIISPAKNAITVISTKC